MARMPEVVLCVEVEGCNLVNGEAIRVVTTTALQVVTCVLQGTSGITPDAANGQRTHSLGKRRSGHTLPSDEGHIHSYVHLKFVTGKEKTYEPLPSVGALFTNIRS